MQKLVYKKLKKVSRDILLSPEIQLLIAANEGSIGTIVCLYAKETEANAVDENGNNILHLAIKNGNIQLVQTVLLLYGNKPELFSHLNGDGKRPDELTYSTEILRCIEIIEKGTLTKSQMGNIRSINKAIAFEINRKNIESRLESGEKLCVLLSLDGGGIRGLILNRILMHLERKLGSLLWNKIDWVAGTSTGAVLALALAEKRSLEYIQRVYFRLKKCVFIGSRPYNAGTFEDFLKNELGRGTMDSLGPQKVLVTTCLTHVAPPKLKIFRNYDLETAKLSRRQKVSLGYDNPALTPIWEAARCSSAAPTYFPPFEEIYSDGGLMANNPTIELMTEFFRHKSIMQCYENVLNDSIGCVISIGTGVPPLTKIGLRSTKIGSLFKTISKYGEYLKNIVTICFKQLTSSDGSIVDSSWAWAASLEVPFFRFSPPLHKTVELNESRELELIDMLWKTEHYMVTKCADEVAALVAFLKQLPLVSPSSPPTNNDN